MSKELASKYDPKEVEDRLYEEWEQKGYFRAGTDDNKPNFSIVIPPPNVTGQLHMGHALDETMQDILVRTKRMQGYNVLWQPGTDHASIATEVKLVQQLRDEEGKTKEDIGREAFMERAWAWKEKYAGRIIAQLKKLGASCDWERTRFTMDEGLSKAVEDVFIYLYKKGWIYKSSRIINWCPKCKTSISDAEVEYETQDSFLWHIRYPFEDGSGSIEIATTRPETLLGDTAVAVHPDDERYTDKVGKMLVLPLVGRKIPVIADEYVEKEFGTGCVKITPAHDPNDFEVGKRHHLEEINVLTDDGHINEHGGKYAGMTAKAAREAMVAELEAQGLLVKAEPYQHNVGVHDRCHTTIEPLIKPQWFVKMDELAKMAIQALKDGDLNFYPERYGKIYLHWMENIRDWCISRQLWWGHRIPAYYCEDCGQTVVDHQAPCRCPKCGGTHFKQDEDCLDTWFSSALWPFSTMGWPEQTEMLKRYYPTNVLVTGYDIIFFWVARMVFSGLEYTKQCPFKDVLIHGLVRDSKGRKMSKSLNNGVDPLEVIDQYGADALRFTLVTGNAPGNDMRYYTEKVEASRNFANKIWNATRFVLMNEKGNEPATVDPADLTAADRWILSESNNLAKNVTEALDKYDLGIAATELETFFWEEFCDWYIEMVKARLFADGGKDRGAAMWTLKTVLKNALKLLHPYMPFITEELYQSLQSDDETIMYAEWPKYREDWNFPNETEEVTAMQEAIRGIRNVRTEMNVPPKQKTTVYFVSDDEKTRRLYEAGSTFLSPLFSASEVKVQADRAGIAETAVSIPLTKATAFIPLEQLVDLEKEKARLQKEYDRLEGEMNRIANKLANPGFAEKAPAAVVEEERKKLNKYTETKQQVAEQLARLMK